MNTKIALKPYHLQKIEKLLIVMKTHCVNEHRQHHLVYLMEVDLTKTVKLKHL